MILTLKIKRILVAVFMLIAAAFSAPTVLAHTKLQSSQPAGGETLAQSPKAVTLVFITPLQMTEMNVITVADRSGARFDKKIVALSDDRKKMSVELEDLAAGVYTVEWKALSADDHLMKGSFKFNVAEQKTPEIAPTAEPVETVTAEAEPPAPQAGITPMQSLVRWLTYLALMTLFGGFAFLLFVLAPSLQAAPNLNDGEKTAAFERGGKRFVSLTFVSLALFLIAAFAALALQTSSVTDTNLAQALTAENLRRVLTQTAYGTMWFVQIGAAFLLVAVAVLLKRSVNASLLWLGLTLAAVLIATLSFTGHARAAQAEHRFAVVSDWLHLVAAGIWTGGIFYLILTLPKSMKGFDDLKRLSVLSRAIPRFSNLAVFCVSLMALTGIYNSWVHLEEWRDFVTLPYGITLLVKIALFALLVALGGFNKFVLRPRIVKSAEENASGGAGTIKDFYFVLGIEAAFVAVVLLLTAIIAFLPHSQHH